MANGNTESVDDAVTVCLNDIAESAGKPFDEGVREHMQELFLPKFTSNHPIWPRYRDVVLRSATFLGRFAALYAEFDKSNTITKNHVIKALKIVKEICPATLAAKPGEPPKGDWCP
jgi:histone H3/H4